MMESFKKDSDKALESIIPKMIHHLMMGIGKWMKSMDLESIDFQMDRLFQELGKRDGSNLEQ